MTFSTNRTKMEHEVSPSDDKSDRNVPRLDGAQDILVGGKEDSALDVQL